MKLTVSSVCNTAASNHAKQPATVDGKAERIGTRLHRSLRKVGIDPRNLYPEAGLIYAAGKSRRGRINVGEQDARRLEANRVCIGNVVADDLQIRGCRIQTAQCC